MMKKKTVLVMSSVVLLSVVGSVKAHAANGDDPLNVDTTAQVSFDQDDEGSTPPTSPEDPGIILPPGNGGEGGEGGKGALRIDWAPSFNFGKQKISNKGTDLVLPVIRTEQQTTTHFVQVSDLRGEDEPEWDLGVTASTLQKGEATKTDGKEITGAKITYTPADILETGTGHLAADHPMWVSKKIDLNNGDRQQLVTAKNDGARGTWSMGMSTHINESEELKGQADDNINLVIPQSEIGKIRKGNYTADLNWNLTSSVQTVDSFMAPTKK